MTRKLILFLSGLCFLLIGCSDHDLERTQGRSKMSLVGDFQTESPDEIQFPVKVLFAIDCSLSMGDEVGGVMAGSDPHFMRRDAVRDFINTYNSYENTSFEIMLWSSNVFMGTRNVNGQRGFTKDTEELNRVLDGMYNDTTTDYLDAESAIYMDIQRDINRSSEENRIRTKYVVIFLSDGLSNAQGQTQPDADIWNSVEDIAQMVEDSGVGSFNFHTFLLLGMFPPGSEGDAARLHAENTLQGMADRGNGQFRLFENAEAIDFINIVDMRLTVEYKITYMVAYNYNVHAGTDLVWRDSDGDGLGDTDEDYYGTSLVNPDTDGDGLSDFFEITVSSPGHELDPLAQDSPCIIREDGDYPDEDLDGLNDCEEYVKGTNRHVTDTDGDGIPDGIEFQMGTNPLEIQTNNDSDFDGAVDWLEVQQHTNVTSSDPIIRQRYAYYYDLQDMGLVPINQGTDLESYVRRYHFEITNIDIMDTEAYTTPWGEERQAGDNLIRFYIAQVPEDTPDVPPVFRMAEVIINMADRGRNIVLSPSDFQLIQ